MQTQMANKKADMSRAKRTPKARNNLDGVRQKYSSDEMNESSSDSPTLAGDPLKLAFSFVGGARTCMLLKTWTRSTIVPWFSVFSMEFRTDKLLVRLDVLMPLDLSGVLVRDRSACCNRQCGVTICSPIFKSIIAYRLVIRCDFRTANI